MSRVTSSVPALRRLLIPVLATACVAVLPALPATAQVTPGIR